MQTTSPSTRGRRRPPDFTPSRIGRFRRGRLDEAAERVHEPHLLDCLDYGLEQARGADELDAALRAREVATSIRLR
jgi:hypothetical protein